MNTYRLHTTDFRLPSTARAVAVGVFDGVHQAHREVIGRILGIRGLTSSVLTFADSVRSLPKEAFSLETADRKAEILENLGVSELIQMEFAAFGGLSPEAFVREILCERLSAKVVACGENFRFGKGGKGDLSLLRTLCEPLGITVCAVPTVTADGAPISSSRIRERLAAGDMPTVHRLLGHPYTIRSRVVEGHHLGRTAGFPTINQPLPSDAAWPAFGVYASTVVVKGKSYRGVTNIGRKPTVGEEAPLAETWILDYEGDLYGEDVILTPVRFLRPEQRFDSTAALFEQIRRDADAVRAFFRPTQTIRAVFLDFDDTLHSRVTAWRRFCDRFAPLYLPDADEARRKEFADTLWELDGDGHGYGDDFIDISYEWLFDTMRTRFGLSASTEQLIADCLPLFAACTAVCDDAVPTLSALREAGMTVGVITNGRSFTQSRKLYHSGLLPLLDTAVIAGDEGVRKPDPELFIRTALRAGIPPEDCVYVGDNPYADIRGAAAAGMTPIYIDRLHENRVTDPTVRRITTLAELPAILRLHDR